MLNDNINYSYECTLKSKLGNFGLFETCDLNLIIIIFHLFGPFNSSHDLIYLLDARK